MAKSFFHLLAQHIGEAFGDLADYFGDRDSFIDILDSLGLEVDTLPAPFTAIAGDAAALRQLLSNLSTAPSIYDTLSIIEAVKGIYDSIASLSSGPSGVDTAAFLETVKHDLMGAVIINSIKARSPKLLSILQLLGFVTFKEILGTPTKSAYTKNQVSFDKIKTFIETPLIYLQSEFQQEEGELDYGGILTKVLDLATAWELYPAYLESDQISLVHFDTFESAAPALSTLAFDLAQNSTGTQKLSLSLTPYFDPTKPALGAQGIALRLSLVSAPITLPFGDDLTVGFNPVGTSGQLADLIVTADSVKLVVAATGGALPAVTANQLISFTYAPAQPIILLGDKTLSNLSAEAFSASLSLRLVNGSFDARLEVAASNSQVSIVGSEGDSFLKKVLPSKLTLPVPLSASISLAEGFKFGTSFSFETQLANNIKVLILDISKLTIGVKADADEGLQGVATADLSIRLGPVTALMQETGVAFSFKNERGNAGPFTISSSFKAPSGIGISVSSDAVEGGGYLYLDAPHHKYAGVAHLNLQLGTQSFNLNALGLLQTELPSNPDAYSLLLLITATFSPIQIGLGFTLSGLGGLVGINRSSNTDYLRGLVRNGGFDQLLFPANVLDNPANALAIADAAFPATEGRYVFGIMAELGWGKPTLLELDVALLIELPDPVRILILGSVWAVLPSRDKQILILHADFLGIIDFGSKRVSFDATLSQSWLLGFTLTGDLAARFYQGDNPLFVITAGGFHPAFQPPAGAALTGLRRITLSLSSGDDLRITLASYFALTSNTVQFGSHLELYMSLRLGLHVEGHLGFDILFQFNPFRVLAHLDAGIAIKRGNSDILSIQLSLDATGPGPWHFWGEASFTIVCFTVSVHLNATLGASTTPTPLPAPNVHDLLTTALRDADSWQIEPPTSILPPGVVLQKPAGNNAKLLLDPHGALVVRQRVTPLGITLQKYGSSTVAPVGGQRFELMALHVGNDSYAVTDAGVEEVRDFFAPEQYQRLTDAQKLSAPSFQMLASGLRLRQLAGLTGSANATRRRVEYEQVVLGADASSTGRVSGQRQGGGLFDDDSELDSVPPVRPVQRLTPRSFQQLARGSALGREVQAALPSARVPAPVAWQETSYSVVWASTLKMFEKVMLPSQLEAEQYCWQATIQDPALVGELLVVPTYQLANAGF